MFPNASKRQLKPSWVVCLLCHDLFMLLWGKPRSPLPSGDVAKIMSYVGVYLTAIMHGAGAIVFPARRQPVGHRRLQGPDRPDGLAAHFLVLGLGTTTPVLDAGRAGPARGR